MKNPDNYEILHIPCNIGKVSDGYHTFDELYEFRKLYNALLFNEWAMAGKFNVHKSKRHHAGDECFGGGWFIVVAILPTGQITNHYAMDDWDLFQIPETPKALYEYDGHTQQDTLLRMRFLCETKQFANDASDVNDSSHDGDPIKALEIVSNWIKQNTSLKK